MKRQISSLVLLFVSLNQLPTRALASASTLTLDLDKSIHAGEGCNVADSTREFLVYRNGLLRVQTTGLGLMLGVIRPELAARANCTVRIPYEVPEGQFVKSIAARLAYGVYKSAGARGSIVARVSAGNVASQAQVSLAQGSEQDVYFATKAFAGEAGSVEQACRLNKGILKIDLATSGQLESAEDKLILETIMGEVKLSARFELNDCP